MLNLHFASSEAATGISCGSSLWGDTFWWPSAFSCKTVWQTTVGSVSAMLQASGGRWWCDVSRLLSCRSRLWESKCDASSCFWRCDVSRLLSFGSRLWESKCDASSCWLALVVRCVEPALLAVARNCFSNHCGRCKCDAIKLLVGTCWAMCRGCSSSGSVWQ